jgi:hypothetical protein
MTRGISARAFTICIVLLLGVTSHAGALDYNFEIIAKTGDTIGGITLTEVYCTQVPNISGGGLV